MNKATLGAAVLVGLTVIPTWADTVTMTDHLSVNGKLTGMSDGVIKMLVQFKTDTGLSKPESKDIQIRDVESIEFNNTVVNLGAPPRSFGITPPPPSAKQAPTNDELILRGGQRITCKLVRIDTDKIHCAGERDGHSRAITRRIMVSVP